jgi:vesicle-fusing ATPase
MGVTSAPTAVPASYCLTPRLEILDRAAVRWVSSVTTMLRREIIWAWHQRGGGVPEPASALPPADDAAAANLDLWRLDAEKDAFFRTHPVARHLTRNVDVLRTLEGGEGAGTWTRLTGALDLDPAGRFVLALALAARLDAALGPVFAACLNDQTRPFATLALAQRLWDRPSEILACGRPDHPLFRFGLLGEAGTLPDWTQPLDVHPILAAALVDPDAPLPVQAIEPAHVPDWPADMRAAIHLAGAYAGRAHVVPVIGRPGADFTGWIAPAGALLSRRLAAVPRHLMAEAPALWATAALAWLDQVDLMVPEGAAEAGAIAPLLAALRTGRVPPVRWFIPIHDAAEIQRWDGIDKAPAVSIPPLGHQARVAALGRGLGSNNPALSAAIQDCARRFRIEAKGVDTVVRALRQNGAVPDGPALERACRAVVGIEMGGLAEQVSPRFTLDDVVLTAERSRQVADIARSMRTLTTVLYGWGLARPMNECGLAIMFCGPPGTGKTMVAEALASELDLPMFRVDLSQVVSKYIGETEKNLRRIFDAAETGDCILFFDEADALFGKRTEVKDSHDRFANIEISYLLERMERFKGLAILSTNRRKDLDDAFKRRLRYIVEFPIPDARERAEIWRRAFPDAVDVTALDMPFLAKQFPLSGGHIRSIAFNACLHAAADSAVPAVDMATVLVAVRREMEKLDRAAGEDLFGHYAPILRAALS